jgi:hypothetical protein
MTFERVKIIANRLLSIAEIAGEVDPRIRAIGELLEVANELNEMLKAIRDQTEATAPEVWAAVRDEYVDAVEQFDRATK